MDGESIAKGADRALGAAGAALCALALALPLRWAVAWSYWDAKAWGEPGPRVVWALEFETDDQERGWGSALAAIGSQASSRELPGAAEAWEASREAGALVLGGAEAASLRAAARARLGDSGAAGSAARWALAELASARPLSVEGADMAGSYLPWREFGFWRDPGALAVQRAARADAPCALPSLEAVLLGAALAGAAGSAGAELAAARRSRRRARPAAGRRPGPAEAAAVGSGLEGQARPM